MIRTLATAAALIAVLTLAGCTAPPPPPANDPETPPATAYSSSEAARTERMETEAAAIRERWAEVQEMEGTPEEKQRAVEELMARERALMRDGEGEAPEPAGDEHPPI